MINLGLTMYEKKYTEICCAAGRGCLVVIISSKESGGVRILFSEEASFVNLISQIVMAINCFLSEKGLLEEN